MNLEYKDLKLKMSARFFTVATCSVAYLVSSIFMLFQ